MAADVPAEVAETASDLTKFIIERVAPYGFMLVEIEGKETLVVVAFDGAARRLNDMMMLSLDASAGSEGEAG